MLFRSWGRAEKGRAGGAQQDGQSVVDEDEDDAEAGQVRGVRQVPAPAAGRDTASLPSNHLTLEAMM